MKERLGKLKDILTSHRLDAILISNPSNIYYISAFSGTDSYCLITLSESYIITDFRYQEQAKKEAAGFEIIAGSENLFKKTAGLINKLPFKEIGFESHCLSVKELDILRHAAKKKLRPTFHIIEKQRMIKTADELKAIKKSALIVRDLLKGIAKEIKKGEREKDIAARVDFLMRKKGADYPAFETIVASGPNASMPHAKTTERKIKLGEPVIIDCGARLNGYNSDLTRTHFVGKISKYFKLIYSTVKNAQDKAISKVAPGVKILEIDKAARDYISERGFGMYFGHAAGHGIGINVHEPPAINSKNQTLLKEGMVFTVEPGIYIPGSGGVRIEDMIMVTAKGHKVLTR